MTTTATKPPFSSSLKADPSSDVYRSESHPLDTLFLPKSVAVVGASERTGSVGRSVLWNLLSSPFGGTVFPVNAKRPSVLGIKAYPSIKDLPDKVDLVVVTTPADTVPELIAEAVELGVPSGDRDLGGLQGVRRARQRAGAADLGDHSRQDAAYRPQLPGRDEPDSRAERDLRAQRGPAGQRRFHQPERRAVHRRAGLELARECRLQRLRFRSAPCWT